MTNKEKFREIFKETFAYTPEDCFPCPKSKKDLFAIKSAEIMKDLSSALIEYSPITLSDLSPLICLFMDVVTNDHTDVDYDLAYVRLDIAETFYKAWPHSVEYYERKGDKE